MENFGETWKWRIGFFCHLSMTNFESCNQKATCHTIRHTKTYDLTLPVLRLMYGLSEKETGPIAAATPNLSQRSIKNLQFATILLFSRRDCVV